MSLRLWLPLNGSTVNNGASSIEITGNPNSWIDGKIGKCASFQTNVANVLVSDSTAFKLGTDATSDFSYCMWLKKTSAASGNMWLFSVSKAASADAGYGYGAKVINNNGGVTFYFGSKNYNKPVNDDEWHHLAFVKSGTNIKIYIDAVQVSDATFSGTYPSYSSYYGFALGGYRDRTSGQYISNPLNGSVSDFRIYDHALSQAEIIEIKKALILHLPLDNPYSTGIPNLYSGDYARGSSSSSTFTKTKLANEDGYNYSLTYTGTGSNYYANIKFPTISRTLIHPGKKYTWSCKIRVNTWSSTSGTPKLSLRSSIKSNDATNGSVTAANASHANGEWRTISRTITLSEGMLSSSTYYYITTEAYNASTETSKAYMTPLVEFYTNSLNVSGAVYTFNIDIKEIQLIESDEYPGWIDNRFVKNCVRDVSGFGNDGTCSGSVTTMSDTPRYDKCYHLDGTSYIDNIPNPLKTTFDEFTISFWCGFDNNDFDNVNFLGTDTEGLLQIVIGFQEGGGEFEFRFHTRWIIENKRFDVSNIKPINHFVITASIKTNELHLYMNGIDSGPYGISSTDFRYIDCGNCLRIGKERSYTAEPNGPLTGKISDLRIYATALTADQVNELYNAPISVSDKGSLLCCECTETDEDGTRAFKSTGAVESYQAAEIVSGTPVDHFSIVKTNYNGIGIKASSIMER